MAMHFSFILLFCNSLIGFSLNCSQKGFIVRCLKRITHGLVMGVGDGFNDMSMLREANVGIQIANQDVPLIFGDLVISKMEDLNYILFVKGKQIYSNFATTALSLITVLTSYSCTTFLSNSDARESGRILEGWTLILLYCHLFLALAYATVSNKSFVSGALRKNPEFYLERKFISQYFLAVCSGCILLGIIDSVIGYYSIKLIMRRYKNPEGSTYSQDTIVLMIFVSLFLVQNFKIYSFFTRLSKKFWLINLAVVVLVAGFLAFFGSIKLNTINRIPVDEIINSPLALIPLVNSVGFSCFLIWVVIKGIVKNLVHPFYF